MQKTNRELKDEAAALAKELDIAVSLDNMNNAALTEMVARLQAQLEAKTRPEVTPEVTEQKRQQPGITTGPLTGATRVSPAKSATSAPHADLPAGHKRPTLEEFVAAGYKAEHYERRMENWEQELRERTQASHEPVDGSADTAAGGPPVAKSPEPAAKPRYPYTVAPGRTIVCPRGTIQSGREIRARDLVHDMKELASGEEALAEFVRRGVVIKANKAPEPPAAE